MKHFKLFLFLTILIFLSLQNNANAQTLPYDSIPVNQNLNALLLQSAIRSELSQLEVESNPISIFIRHWYETHNYQPMWIQSAGNNLKIDTLLRFISHIDVHGLKSRQLDFNNISKLSNQFKNNKLSYHQMAQLDTKVSTAFIQYCAGLTYGFINPGIFEAYHKSIQKADTIFISKCFNAGNSQLLFFLSRIQPRSKAYLSLQAERDNYKNFVDSFFTSIPLLAEKQTIK